MSDREKAIELLKQIPDSKMFYALRVLKNVATDEHPNAKTVAAFSEGDKMILDQSGQKYSNMQDFFADLEA